jgi:hypothetical protein
MKTCKQCKIAKELTDFPYHKDCIDNRANVCKGCKIINQREARKINGNAYTKKYEKSIPGFIMRAYRNMKSRVFGIQIKKYHLYADKHLIDKSSFYEWSFANADFHRLYNQWEKNNYSRKLTPSVDRIDSRKGYTLDNMQWITHSENSRKTSRWNKVL